MGWGLRRTRKGPPSDWGFSLGLKAPIGLLGIFRVDRVWGFIGLRVWGPFGHQGRGL